MAKKSRMSVLKRQRERKKAEKAALKRERRGLRKDGELLVATEIEKQRSNETRESQVATKEDLEGYGFTSDEDSDAKDD
jgi:hypothetical protein